jgi:jasmonate ZIM domain-containing protein
MILCVIILRDTEKKDKSQQLTIFYGGKVLVFNDFPADKAKDLMQLASKSSPVVQNVGVPQPSAPATVTDNTKVHKAMPAPVSSLPVAQASDAKKPARANASGTCYFLFFPVVYCRFILIQSSKYGLPNFVMLIIHLNLCFSFVDMPIARKASLHRFLEKRKDR